MPSWSCCSGEGGSKPTPPDQNCRSPVRESSTTSGGVKPPNPPGKSNTESNTLWRWQKPSEKCHTSSVVCHCLNRQRINWSRASFGDVDGYRTVLLRDRQSSTAFNYLRHQSSDSAVVQSSRIQLKTGILLLDWILVIINQGIKRSWL